MTNICRTLEWDSQFFGHRIARVEQNWLDRQSLEKSLSWCAEQGIECLYFLSAADDDVTVELVEAAGFHFVDVRVELNWKAVAVSQPPNFIREFQRNDLAELQQIASQQFAGTRFSFDRHFGPDQIAELYKIWVTGSCQNDSHKVFVAANGSDIAGFITCQFDSARVGRIGLIALKSEAQGKGFGRQLVQASQHFFFSSGAEEVRVVTQGRKITAQRLYQSRGFRMCQLGLWYHKWF